MYLFLLGYSLRNICANPYAGLISDVAHAWTCSKDHNRDSGQTSHKCRKTNEVDVTRRKCACVTSAGHMIQIERLGESRADPAENTCEMEQRMVVINYARNKHSFV